MGHRRLNLSKAMAGVMREFGDIEMSHTIETAAHGYESEHKFLNVCIMFRTELEPAEVLHRLQAIEKSISPASHRTAEGGYADRVIDIDLIAIDDCVVDSEELQLPHPHLAEREFYLKPLEEIAPGWTHPLTGLTATDMLKALPSTESSAD